ncbi:hypothetical protein Igag_0992 [Ignisphaera aggregans DSM 17230]|uniref:HypC/HybG/HupF family hydrogenase formation chaperone n=1 Tax=Ignisphaera aggregans (strain DSM 17230 / JCM 13409 / AQ1.S1) TaxID=583356 RepID=E0SNL1_IGNAA|nr:hypothetical protein Igag_0992 [Ignisphaera aggregans DSM 17230]
MCLGVVGRVEEIMDMVAKVNIGGAIVEVINAIEDLAVGDLVIVHAGLAIEKISREGLIDNIVLFYDIQKYHYIANGYSEEEAARMALNDIVSYGAELGISVDEIISRISLSSRYEKYFGDKC